MLDFNRLVYKPLRIVKGRVESFGSPMFMS